ncbi:MAG TPA: iron ABC transporter permease [Geminicoccaceae bacterium]|nr:iron ABC transporter permease [Geminicoccaceae bacterium]
MRTSLPLNDAHPGAAPRGPWLPDRWTVLAVALAMAVALPVMVVFASVLVPTAGVWSHLAQTVLWDYLANTALLALGVGLGVIAIGVGAAWLVSMCDFPGRSVFEWALLLPLAVPTYIIGYTYTDLLQFAGPVQTLLRDVMDWGRADYWFPPIRSLGGAIAVMTLVLYPYVYLLSRASFLEQCTCMIDVSRTLGRGPWGSFFEVAVPLARPAIAGGVALALMEALADFGTVQYFGVDTFTTGIYRTWFALGEPVAAAQLAAALMLLVLLVLAAERWSRGLARYQHTAQSRLRPCYHLRGAWAALALAACTTPVALGFGVPVAVLAAMALGQGDALFGGLFVELAWNSLSLAAIAAALTTALAIVVGYGLRLRASATMRVSARVAGLGYAIPGAVIAVGVLIPFARLDNALDAWLQARFGISTGLLLTGTVAGLVFAYLVRFLALALNTVEAGLGKINRNLDDAARILGRGPGGALFRVHVPLMWGSVLTAVILVFVDVLKELPATLILRPFNFETLAVRVYRFAADERLAEASTAALAIVVVGLIPVILLSRAIARARPAAETAGPHALKAHPVRPSP